MAKPTVKLLKRYLLPTGAHSLDVRPDGSMVYAACQDGVYELNLESGARRLLYPHESWVSGVAFHTGTHSLISAGYDGALTWYDLAAGKVTRTVKAHEFWSWQMALSPDGRRVASVTGQYLAGGPKYEPAPEREPSVKLFDAVTGKLLHALPHVPSVQAVAFSPDSRYVAAGNLMGEVRTWDAQTGAQVGTIKSDGFTSWGIIKNHHYIGGIFALHFAPGGEELLLAGMGPMEDPMAGNGRQLWQRYAWRAAPPRMADETAKGSSGEGLMETLAFHPSGEWFVMAGRLRGGSWNAAFFNLADGALLHSLNTDTRVTRACFTPDGKRLLLSGMRGQPGFKDGTIPDWGHVDLFEVQ